MRTMNRKTFVPVELGPDLMEECNTKGGRKRWIQLPSGCTVVSDLAKHIIEKFKLHHDIILLDSSGYLIDQDIDVDILYDLNFGRGPITVHPASPPIAKQPNLVASGIYLSYVALKDDAGIQAVETAQNIGDGSIIQNVSNGLDVDVENDSGMSDSGEDDDKTSAEVTNLETTSASVCVAIAQLGFNGGLTKMDTGEAEETEETEETRYLEVSKITDDEMGSDDARDGSISEGFAVLKAMEDAVTVQNFGVDPFPPEFQTKNSSPWKFAERRKRQVSVKSSGRSNSTVKLLSLPYWIPGPEFRGVPGRRKEASTATFSESPAINMLSHPFLLPKSEFRSEPDTLVSKRTRLASLGAEENMEKNRKRFKRRGTV